MVEECFKMPVVELSYSRSQKLIGKSSKKQISDSLPFLGLDIESEDKDLVRIEYSPNRPDYSTDFGIALGMQGLLGIKTGTLKLKIKKSQQYSIKINLMLQKLGLLLLELWQKMVKLMIKQSNNSWQCKKIFILELKKKKKNHLLEYMI